MLLEVAFLFLVLAIDIERTTRAVGCVRAGRCRSWVLTVWLFLPENDKQGLSNSARRVNTPEIRGKGQQLGACPNP